ncbi:helix-turn-helix transcriptional regulator [Paraburkholderia sp. J7]|uniref:helix-turn-helix transcriptional regulator n=1 Tax=Paraburkholderia sp. J7 TaxID=2805438 RepID=UPI002AB736EA|nr:helix-turn-helix transcriptional regulator [Paraburkholderia sp. J7]
MPNLPKAPDRARPARHLRLPPFTDVLPTPVFFRMEHMPSHATYPQMCHPWGEFVYAFSGTTEVKAGDEHYITPPHLGLWIAPGTEHVGFNEQETVHCSVYISRDLCTRMPATSCAVMVSPLVRAILEHLRVTPVEEEGEAPRARLLRVLVDQLSTCATTGSFVPHTDDADLNAILQVLRQNPADNRSLAELADAFHMSERTLMRRAQHELGMSLTEWRQRIRLVNALPMLHAGRSVEAVALDLGYATSSAFIAMFRRLTGTSPGQFVARTR